MILVGVVLAVTAATLGTTSKQLIAASDYYSNDWLFRLGAFLNLAVGPVVDAAAYSCAPSVVVAPLACLDVIINAVSAPYTLHWQKEQLTRAHGIGVVFVTIGAIFTSLFAEGSSKAMSVYDWEHQLFFRPVSLLYLGVELLLVLGVLGALRQGRMRPAARGIALGVAGGMLMGNVFFAKGLLSIIGSMISQGRFGVLLRPTPYIFAIGALGGPFCGHLFMRQGLAEYKGVFMVTIFEGAHVAAACLSGCIVMEEMSESSWSGYFKYWFGVMLILSGLLSINTAAKDARLEQKDSSKASSPTNTPPQLARRLTSRLRSRGKTTSFQLEVLKCCTPSMMDLHDVVMGSVVSVHLRGAGARRSVSSILPAHEKQTQLFSRYESGEV